VENSVDELPLLLLLLLPSDVHLDRLTLLRANGSPDQLRRLRGLSHHRRNIMQSVPYTTRRRPSENRTYIAINSPGNHRSKPALKRRH
jgi:hypothetical protein